MPLRSGVRKVILVEHRSQTLTILKHFVTGWHWVTDLVPLLLETLSATIICEAFQRGDGQSSKGPVTVALVVYVLNATDSNHPGAARLATFVDSAAPGDTRGLTVTV